MARRGSAAGVLVFAVLLMLAVTSLHAQERVRIDGQVQWVAGTRMQVMTGGGSVPVDLRQVDQAAHRGLRAGERVSVDGVIADDRGSIVARQIWRVTDQDGGQAPCRGVRASSQ